MNFPQLHALIALFLALGLASPTDLAARELPHAAPALAGMSDDRLGRISGAINAAIDSEQFAGAVVLILRRGDLVYLEAFGMADRDLGRQMRIDDLFRIASMTKAVTSTAVMMLYEEGHFLLDDPIGKYLPAFDRDMQVVARQGDDYTLVPAERAITIRHLLTHTSGLSYRFNGQRPVISELYAEAGITDGFASERITLEVFVERLAEMPLAHQPGDDWTYSLSTDVLGRLIEVVSGKPLDQFLTERIFLPLDMFDTHFRVPQTKRDRIARVYQPGVDGQLASVPDGRIERGSVVFTVDYPVDAAARYLSGGAGLTSTARDYARFLQMLLNGGTLDGERLLSRKTVELMTSDQTSHLTQAALPASGFTLGFAYDGGPSVSGRIGSTGVYGWSGFFNTSYWADPEEQLIAILMTQHFPFGIEMLEKIRVLVYQAIDD